MSKPICIIAEADWVPPDSLTKLEEHFTLKRGPFTKEELAIALKDATGILVGLDHYLDEALLGPNVKFIVSPTTGLNHIDLDYAVKAGIKIISLKGHEDFLNEVYATAELCWGLIIALKRKLPWAHAHAAGGQWDRDSFHGSELHSATLGIIGLGRLGKKIARYGLAFGMNVLACDVKDNITMDGVEICEMQRVLSESDVVSLHADSSPANYHMIGAAEFAKMKSTATFINTARGDLVDEAGLLKALESGKIAGAALDVLEQEFNTDFDSAPIIRYAEKHENLLLTPHIGGVTPESLYKTTHFVVGNVLKWWKDENK